METGLLCSYLSQMLILIHVLIYKATRGFPALHNSYLDVCSLIELQGVYRRLKDLRLSPKRGSDPHAHFF